jgi:hypothetical protein
MWPRKKKKRRVFAWLSDTHAGKKTGLLNPDTVLLRVQDDGSEEEWQPEPTMTQRWLWSVYENAVSDLADYAGDDEILIAHCGDITHGDKHAGTIPETTREDQRIIACDNFHPLLALPQLKKMRFLTGTEAHVPECAEARIAARLRDETGLDIAVCHHARFHLGHDFVDAAHHGPYPGSRDWLRGNVAFYYLKDKVYEDRRIGKEPSAVYVRGHYHRFLDVPFCDRWQGIDRTHHLIIVPALSGQDSFIRKVGKSPPIVQAGIVALEFIGGRLTEIKPFIEETDLRTEETL